MEGGSAGTLGPLGGVNDQEARLLDTEPCNQPVACATLSLCPRFPHGLRKLPGGARVQG